eukprot:TRINITY_DN13328_c0_g1_i1.p1 TRINITY_DN13328_c0_g1~~TRINITY_DN13328_c0_g1_i1.p1  ORF type:complete len:626 (+),score=93.81 TRINITY_DN13328_c0_g1_i1:110-1987(+)
MAVPYRAHYAQPQVARSVVQMPVQRTNVVSGGAARRGVPHLPLQSSETAERWRPESEAMMDEPKTSTLSMSMAAARLLLGSACSEVQGGKDSERAGALRDRMVKAQELLESVMVELSSAAEDISGKLESCRDRDSVKVVERGSQTEPFLGICADQSMTTLSPDVTRSPSSSGRGRFDSLDPSSWPELSTRSLQNYVNAAGSKAGYSEDGTPVSQASTSGRPRLRSGMSCFPVIEDEGDGEESPQSQSKSSMRKRLSGDSWPEIESEGLQHERDSLRHDLGDLSMKAARLVAAFLPSAGVSGTGEQPSFCVNQERFAAAQQRLDDLHGTLRRLGVQVDHSLAPSRTGSEADGTGGICSTAVVAEPVKTAGAQHRIPPRSVVETAAELPPTVFSRIPSGGSHASVSPSGVRHHSPPPQMLVQRICLPTCPGMPTQVGSFTLAPCGTAASSTSRRRTLPAQFARSGECPRCRSFRSSLCEDLIAANADAVPLCAVSPRTQVAGGGMPQLQQAPPQTQHFWPAWAGAPGGATAPCGSHAAASSLPLSARAVSPPPQPALSFGRLDTEPRCQAMTSLPSAGSPTAAQTRSAGSISAPYASHLSGGSSGPPPSAQAVRGKSIPRWARRTVS